MKIQTLSLLTSNTSCNAGCPFCVAKMTPFNNVGKTQVVDMKNFDTACKFAKSSGVSTVIITSKGEPTLNPEEITHYLDKLVKYDFPFIELQTNGIELYSGKINQEILETWKYQGLTTISISCVHYNRDKNQEIYGKKYYHLSPVVTKLQKLGFSIRLSCVMLDGYIDGVVPIFDFVQWAKTLQEQVQLTFRPVVVAQITSDVLTTAGKQAKIQNWTENHEVSKKSLQDINATFKVSASITPLLNLVHGATVYDYQGQNVCLTNCLTRSKNEDEVRQLIYFPDGRLRYDWEYEGAILL